MVPPWSDPQSTSLSPSAPGADYNSRSTTAYATNVSRIEPSSVRNDRFRSAAGGEAHGDGLAAELLRAAPESLPRSRSLTPLAKAALLVELIVIFILLPTAYHFGWIGVRLIPAIVLLALVTTFALLMDRRFDRRRFWFAGAVRRELPRIAALFAVSAVLVASAVVILTPDRFLELVRTRTGLWFFIMIFYPIFSVYPQEIIFRGFFFHRYQAIFQRPWALIAASAAVFGYVHIILGNLLAVVLCAIGGVFFGWTYLRSRSLLTVTIEHALYGGFIFTVGLGKFFYLAPTGG